MLLPRYFAPGGEQSRRAFAVFGPCTGLFLERLEWLPERKMMRAVSISHLFRVSAATRSVLGRYVIALLILGVLTALSFMVVQSLIARMEASEDVVAIQPKVA